MAKRPDDRYPTAGAFAAALLEAMEPPVQAPPPTAAPPPRGRRTRLLAGAVAGAAVVVLLLVVLLTRGGGHPAGGPSASGSGHTTGAASPTTPTVANSFGTVVRVDATADAVGGTFVGVIPHRDVGTFTPLQVSIGEGAVWVADFAIPGSLFRIDPRSGDVTRIPIRPPLPRASDVAAGPHDDWVALIDDGAGLARIDAATAQELTPMRFPSVGGVVDHGILGLGGKWVWTATGSKLWRVDRRTGRLAGSYDTSGSIDALAVTPDAVWIVDQLPEARGGLSRRPIARVPFPEGARRPPKGGIR
jgi:hypothetical protein